MRRGGTTCPHRRAHNDRSRDPACSLQPVAWDQRGANKMDTLSSEERSQRMSRVRSRDTKPEMVVRKLVHGLGYRYRLHSRSLPGQPDLVFAARRKVILVHGCFWHRHRCPLGDRLPKSRLDFWRPKLERNRTRDLRSLRALRRAGWAVMIVWECEIRKYPQDVLRERLGKFLGESRSVK
jgi:DNA mismatch endonuclease, patch repair protein